jgi:hypothetical protein
MISHAGSLLLPGHYPYTSFPTGPARKSSMNGRWPFEDNRFKVVFASQVIEHVPIDHPAFPGVAGYIRVLTVRQARELFEWRGFEFVEVRSISIMPIPDSWSRWLERWILSRGHFLLVRARKPR